MDTNFDMGYNGSNDITGGRQKMTHNNGGDAASSGLASHVNNLFSVTLKLNLFCQLTLNYKICDISVQLEKKKYLRATLIRLCFA